MEKGGRERRGRGVGGCRKKGGSEGKVIKWGVSTAATLYQHYVHTFSGYMLLVLSQLH
jgi:hypothetical protein